MCSFYAGRLKKPGGQLKGEPCSTLETELHVKDGLCCFGLSTENSTFSPQKKLKAQLDRGFTTNITTQDHIKINMDV